MGDERGRCVEIKCFFAKLFGKFQVYVCVTIVLVGFEKFPNVNELILDSLHFHVIGNDGRGDQFPETDDAIVFVIIA